MRIISVINQKGGVGKTTTVLNVGHALVLAGYRVLLIDLDPQSHLTDSLGLHAYEGEGVDDVILNNQSIENNTLMVREGLGLLPAGARLAAVDSLVSGGAKRGWHLHSALEKVENFDYVLIDSPPSAGLITMNGLLASQELLIPVASDYLSLHGLSRLMPMLAQIETSLHRKTKKWIVLTRFQKTRRLAREVQQKLHTHFPDYLMSVPIRENVSLAESPSYGQTIFEYKKRSYGAMDYMSLAISLINDSAAHPPVVDPVCTAL